MNKYKSHVARMSAEGRLRNNEGGGREGLSVNMDEPLMVKEKVVVRLIDILTRRDGTEGGYIGNSLMRSLVMRFDPRLDSYRQIIEDFSNRRMGLGEEGFEL